MYKGFITCSVRTILFMLIEAIKDDCRCCQWVGSSDSAAEAASPGAKPHRARQGYAAGMVGRRVKDVNVGVYNNGCYPLLTSVIKLVSKSTNFRGLS